jgi:hypothetical protein
MDILPFIVRFGWAAVLCLMIWFVIYGVVRIAAALKRDNSGKILESLARRRSSIETFARARASPGPDEETLREAREKDEDFVASYGKKRFGPWLPSKSLTREEARRIPLGACGGGTLPGARGEPMVMAQ